MLRQGELGWQMHYGANIHDPEHLRSASKATGVLSQGSNWRGSSLTFPTVLHSLAIVNTMSDADV